MSGLRPPYQGMQGPSGLLYMQRGTPPAMGLSTRQLGREQTVGSPNRVGRAKVSAQKRQQRREGETEKIKKMFMGCLIGAVASGSPTLEEVRQGLWQRLTAGDRQRCGNLRMAISSSTGSQWRCTYRSRDRHKGRVGTMKSNGDTLYRLTEQQTERKGPR